MSNVKQEGGLQLADYLTLVDQYAHMKAERLAMQRVVNKLEKEEEKLKEQLLALQNPEVVDTPYVVAQFYEEDKPEVFDWDQLYTHIWENKEFDLLEKRVGRAAMKDRWKEGEDVPGVRHLKVKNVKLTYK